MNAQAEEYRRILHAQLPQLKSRYHVANLAMFGSFVRGGEGSKSDLDLLVRFSEAPGLLSLVELENYLTDLLGVKVDLVLQDSLKPRIGKRILQEMTPV